MLRRVAWIIAAVLIGSVVRHGLWRATESSKSTSMISTQDTSTRALERFSARVAVVEDGDTVDVLDASGRKHRIRFYGADAPEIAHDGRPAQRGGVEASAWVSERVAGRIVVIEVMDHDRWGREVGRIIFEGEDLNLGLIRNGWAWAYRQYLREPFAAPYIAAEEAARRERRGLWADSNPTAPWNWRHQ